MSTPARHPITTHVLDSTAGLPAPAIPVTLTLLEPYHATETFTAITSSDGRIAIWDTPGSIDLDSLISKLASLGTEDDKPLETIWSLKFNTLKYWGPGNTFYPEVELKFFVNVRDVKNKQLHYHVPLLLGPYGFTTYRGS
ncbi:hypothetical protein MMC19_006492 [Ptychographa xylographoides]|nr:hypothetical protein [Ptychographa xylographoides]